ncbi:hypothetical protein JCGZ_14368 [Jatropha curcas]|uniref:Uncharacterized protein n=1 Tax=Jatropha curcas TaxID=180498 RepID=A0A067JXH5_JATCU|nr:hypothetical protein JCGZ_14368 [Jatropha curcas]
MKKKKKKKNMKRKTRPYPIMGSNFDNVMGCEDTGQEGLSLSSIMVSPMPFNGLGLNFFEQRRAQISSNAVFGVLFMMVATCTATVPGDWKSSCRTDKDQCFLLNVEDLFFFYI